ncbi:Transposase DDE domain-containing protein [Bradyrhizobium brasilense]|uniref:Transposase DDE domain-containing protein n=1 Tax=Bradyrhizobium brasilense TaxID=1419277 RepID=A0A1G6UL22_9BRAD|nr:Transposase DDE domain-containing protein [Bradyrhizobium brasilense]
MPDHSTFSKNRHGRFRESDLFRHVFESVLCRCIEERLVGGEGFAVDASLIKADANRQKGIEGDKGLPPEAAGRAIDEYLAVLDDAAFGAATEVTPKFVSPADPAARWTGAHGGQAFFSYSTNYLIDVENAIIIDVEAATAIRQAEVLTAKRMIERSLERFDLYPSRLLGNSGYGSAEMLGWLVYEHGIEPYVTVFDKSTRTDGIFSREDFAYDHADDVYRCPGGKVLTTTGTLVNDGATMLYLASKRDCDRCALKSRCCPKQPSRRVPRSIYEGARDMARQIARSWEGRTSRRLRKKIEMLFAHLKRILKLDRLRLRGPNGARDEFILAATAQNLRKMAKLIRCQPRGSHRTGRGSATMSRRSYTTKYCRSFSTESPYADIRHPGPRPLGLGSANGATSTVTLSVARSRSIVSRTC